MPLEEGPFRRRLREWREKKPIQGQENQKQLALIDKLIRQVEEARRDEAEAWRFYDKMRTDMVTVFPPGTPQYNTFVRIVADEMRHLDDLYKIKRALEEKRVE